MLTSDEKGKYLSIRDHGHFSFNAGVESEDLRQWQASVFQKLLVNCRASICGWGAGKWSLYCSGTTAASPTKRFRASVASDVFG